MSIQPQNFFVRFDNPLLVSLILFVDVLVSYLILLFIIYNLKFICFGL
jgi:hypothetical protein